MGLGRRYWVLNTVTLLPMLIVRFEVLKAWAGDIGDIVTSISPAINIEMYKTNINNCQQIGGIISYVHSPRQ